jgi:cGMP-dependent protein kinase 1
MFYGSCILAAFSFMHDKGIVYRNLKPENIVLDATGYLKLTDFMYSKQLLGIDSSTTICGSPEYISPEMVLSKPHNRAVDYWALGVFLFELLTRSTPFDHPTTAGIYQRVLASGEHLPTAFKPTFDQEESGRGGIARDIVTQLLNSNPAIRLGMLRNGTNDLWSHQFFKGMSLDSIQQKSRTAPFIPTLNGPLAQVSLIDLDDIPTPKKYTGKTDFSNF